MVKFPLGAADDSADPLGRAVACRLVFGRRFKFDLVPKYESFIALDPNAGVGADLSFEDTRGGSSPLTE
jgi:hypothetical protein